MSRTHAWCSPQASWHQPFHSPETRFQSQLLYTAWSFPKRHYLAEPHWNSLGNLLPLATDKKRSGSSSSSETHLSHPFITPRQMSAQDLSGILQRHVTRPSPARDPWTSLVCSSKLWLALGGDQYSRCGPSHWGKKGKICWPLKLSRSKECFKIKTVSQQQTGTQMIEEGVFDRTIMWANMWTMNQVV